MATTQPIKNKAEIMRLKEYFVKKREIRNYVLITLGLNTSIRISDLLNLQWKDVYNFRLKKYRKHISIIEQKTDKHTMIPLNREVIKALDTYREESGFVCETDYIFKSRVGNNKPIGRTQAFRIIKHATEELNIEGIIACHSLRKTFGYQAWKQGVPPAVIMSIYNHSSLEVTKRYLSIDQDERDAVFMKLNL